MTPSLALLSHCTSTSSAWMRWHNLGSKIIISNTARSLSHLAIYYVPVKTRPPLPSLKMCTYQNLTDDHSIQLMHIRPAHMHAPAPQVRAIGHKFKGSHRGHGVNGFYRLALLSTTADCGQRGSHSKMMGSRAENRCRKFRRRVFLETKSDKIK